MTNIKKRGGQAVRYITLVLTTVAIILTLLAISVLTGTDVKSNTVEFFHKRRHSFRRTGKQNRVSP